MTTWTDLVGWTLVHFVWEGIAIALVTALTLRLLRRAVAQSRYVVACTGLLLALLAPVVTAMLLASAAATSADAIRQSAGEIRTIAVPSRPAPAALPAVVSGGPLPLHTGPVRRVLPFMVTCWALGVLLLTGRLTFGWWQVRRLQQEALAESPSEWLGAAQRIASRLGLPRIIHVVDSHRVDTPTVIGWLQPVVLLPVAAMTNLTPGQVQAILAHELAHVRRHDFIVNLLQTIGETLLFYHPAVWWMSSRIRVEREHCCDDIAVDVCGDPIGYAEALTTLASWARARIAAPDAGIAGSRLAVAATGGSLLHRVRRLLSRSADAERTRPKAAFVVGGTVLLIVIVGMRLMLVAQTVPDLSGFDRPLGPTEINQLLGYQLFPGPVHHATDDPTGARAWEVKVAYPDGEMTFKGFTARSLIRYAYSVDGMPVMDGPAWLDRESLTVQAETSVAQPNDQDFRDAIRSALESQYGFSIRRDARLVPVYGLQVANPGSLGPNIRPATIDCIEDLRKRPDVLGPSLHARGEVVLPFCGIDNTIRGPKGYRVTLRELARSLRGFNMNPEDLVGDAPEVVDQTGLSGVYDYELNLGFLPLAAIASVHPNLAVGLGPIVRTFPQALDEQLGLRLVRSESPRDVIVVETARQAVHDAAGQFERQLATLDASK